MAIFGINVRSANIHATLEDYQVTIKHSCGFRACTLQTGFSLRKLCGADCPILEVGGMRQRQRNDPGQLAAGESLYEDAEVRPDGI